MVGSIPSDANTPCNRVAVWRCGRQESRCHEAGCDLFALLMRLPVPANPPRSKHIHVQPIRTRRVNSVHRTLRY